MKNPKDVFKRGTPSLNSLGAAIPESMHSAFESCATVDEMRSLAPLPKDAQELVDDAVNRVGMDRLVFVDDIMSEGLVTPINDPLSVMEVYWEKISRAGHARRVMMPGSRGERAKHDRKGTRIPVYVTEDNFDFNTRFLRAAARSGQPVDTEMVEETVRNINEAIEDAGLNGVDITTIDGNTAPGVLNAPNAANYTYIDTESWLAAGHSGKDITDDVMGMADLLEANRYFGPYNLYVGTKYGNHLNENWSDGVTTFDMTIRERIERMVYGGRNIRIRVVDQLPETKTMLIQMTKNVLDVLSGQEPTVFSWPDGPGLNRFWLAMAIIVPRFRDDYDGKSGICIGDSS